MKNKKNKKKVKNLRNVTMLMLVCVLMLSAATYAWFTLSESATVTDLSMTVGSGGGGLLFQQYTNDSGQLSDYSATFKLTDSYSAVPKASTPSALFYPATTSTVLTTGNALSSALYGDAKHLAMCSPKYDEARTHVIGVDNLTSSNEKDGKVYYYETTFFAKIPDGDANTVKPVYLSPAKTSITAAGNDGIANEAIRVAFTIAYDNEVHTAVYQYQGDKFDFQPAEGTYASDTALGKDYGEYTTITQKADKSFDKGDSKLFDMPVGRNIPMTVQVWFEGHDQQCSNIISGKGITGMFEFVTEAPTGVTSTPETQEVATQAATPTSEATPTPEVQEQVVPADGQ